MNGTFLLTYVVRAFQLERILNINARFLRRTAMTTDTEEDEKGFIPVNETWSVGSEIPSEAIGCYSTGSNRELSSRQNQGSIIILGDSNAEEVPHE